jgi:NADH:ubiquinone oxidoreductase subunit 6 (subunit J)
VNQALFLVIATLGVLAALGTVLVRNLVHAALFLVAFFFLVACQFVMLEAEFLAAVQVLVYIGAVAILLMFGIMLTRNIQGDETTRVSRFGMVASGLAVLGLLIVLILGIHREEGPIGHVPWREITERPAIGSDASASEAEKGRAVNNMGLTVGAELLSRYLIAFEVAGLLLTAALVGAIALAIQEGPHDDDPAARVRDHSATAPNTDGRVEAPLASAGSTSR